MPAVHPLAELVGTELVDVVPNLRVLDHPGGKEVQFHIAGNGSAKPGSFKSGDRGRIGYGITFLLPEFKVPLSVKGYLFMGG